MSDIIRQYESQVRSYCRSFPCTFTRAKGSRLWTRDEQEYVDFFAGAGALNYGHNHPHLKQALLDYIESDGVAHSLDMFTLAKERFLAAFHEVILEPRGMDHKVMFTGPTGTNAIEAALKLARRYTERTDVIAFTNAFHGMTLGALAATGNRFNRSGAGLPLHNVVRVPYDDYEHVGDNSAALLESLVSDGSSGVPKPAGIVLETIQAEGGVNVSSFEWLRDIAALAKQHGLPLIVDDIQVGCGRTGPFFSFEEAGIEPDIICLSKSLSGYGLPFAVVLVKPEMDIWEPGEHNGTFRGNNLAFVTATAALDFWRTDALAEDVERKSASVMAALDDIAEATGASSRRGRGMIQGIEWDDDEIAGRVAAAAFDRGLIIETAGARSQVLKFLAPLNISDEDLGRGLDILEQSAAAVCETAELTTT